MLGQVFLAHLEPIGTGFGPLKIPIWLEQGPFWEQKWVNLVKSAFFQKQPWTIGGAQTSV